SVLYHVTINKGVWDFPDASFYLSVSGHAYTEFMPSIGKEAAGVYSGGFSDLYGGAHLLTGSDPGDADRKK
ncbi:MAG: hypothetical protein IJL90_04735, partial [Lachnospiraceae bacterium]|nr:hypothetical protein [Lachnospiraceae bacterium]